MNTESMKKARGKYEEKVKIFSVGIDKEVFAVFDDYCKQVGATKKNIIEAAILEYIDKH